MDKKELYSEDVENNVLGCIIVSQECKRRIKNICENDFYIPKNKIIFRIIKELELKRMPIDIIDIKELAKAKGINEKNVFEHLVKITEIFVTSENIDFYINRLKNYSMRREIEQKAKNIIMQMQDIDVLVEAEEIKRNCIREISNINTTNDSSRDKEMIEVMAEATKDIEEKYNKKDDNTYKTGFFELDKVTDGLHEQEFTIIAARPGLGKTSFALNLAENISKRGVYTYFASLEMSEKQIGNRMISSKSGIDSHKLRCGWLEEEDFLKIGETAVEISNLKMIIDTNSTTVQEIENKTVELKGTKNMGLIVIDYIQLLKSKDKFAIREQEVADISRRLKLLSRELNIPVIALCQLNRETEKRKRPVLADLRESGSLEQDADNVIFLYAEEQEKREAVRNIEFIIAKQRNGPTGAVFIKFDSKTMTFKNNY